MATGQSLLDRMEVLNQELQLQPGEADVNRGLVALNMAQDQFETLASKRVNILGSGSGTISTSSGVETTAFPTGVLRIDRLQLVDVTTNRPKRNIDPIKVVGGASATSSWPYYLFNTGSGEPNGYETNGTLIYWSPLPAGNYTIRWRGFQIANDITASGTFTYPDVVMLPLASFAVQLLSLGVGDTVNDISTLSSATLESVLDTLESHNRDGAIPFQYTEIHTE